MKVVITGTSRGIGQETAMMFLERGHEVYGLDIKRPSIIGDPHYHHIECDVSNPDSLPDIEDVEILINNAGVQNSEDDIGVNLKGVIYCTKKYADMNDKLKSIVNIASVSAHNGAEFPEYCASKGGVISYTINTAKRIAPNAVCNSLSFGGVEDELNWPVMQHDATWKAIMDCTPMKKWMTVTECAEWIYFFAVVNKSCTAQDLIIDNGETFNHTFYYR